jgi:MFS family permease
MMLRPASSLPFVLCYVFAMFGAFIAFVPLVGLILPQKIAALSGVTDSGGPVRALSWLLVAGGIMAGFSNIAAGHISDRLFARLGSRRALIVVGLALVIAALALFDGAQSFTGLVLAMLAFQLALNLLLSPLVALMVDYIADEYKGSTAGWLGLALPVGSLSVSLLVVLRPIGPVNELAVTALLTAVLVMPLALLWPVPSRAARHVSTSPAAGLPQQPGLARNFSLAWVARLFVQFAAAAILPYLYYYVTDVARLGKTPAQISDAVGLLAFVFALASTAGGLGAGWMSDRIGRRQPVLVTTALMVSLGMILLASAQSWVLIVTAYALFAAGLAGFLAVDNALVAQLVSSSNHRATLLGVMNLTNTLPSIMAPAATLFLVGGSAVGMVITLKAAAAGAVFAALCSSQIRSARQ